MLSEVRILRTLHKILSVINKGLPHSLMLYLIDFNFPIMIIKHFIDSLVNSYLRKTDPVKWARRLGVTVGEHTAISPDTHFPSEPYLVSIGNHVQVTRAVSIYTHGGGHIVRRQVPDFDCFGKVIIEDWAYIGSQSQIMPGVTIGKGSLVAAGSVVTKSVAPGTVVAGNPAKVICTVEDYIRRNSIYNTKTAGLNSKDKKSRLLELSDQIFIKK